MFSKNNLISITQWNELIKAVSKNRSDTNQPKDTMYVGENKIDNGEVTKTRYFCYDNYDRYVTPGFDLIISNDSELGKLTVYNGSVKVRAPITFAEGKQIAENFFNFHGSQLAEDIVCEWVMNGNKSVF